jgi:signal transduction histidine kinase
VRNATGLLEGKRILTVDDSRAVRHEGLAEEGAHGAEVEEAASGQEALAVLAAGARFDLIVIDLILPDLSGIDLVQRLRAADDASTIVMLSGAGDIATAMSAVREGADGFLEKRTLDATSDSVEFYYGLEQAFHHRQGIAAQRQVEQLKADFYSMVTHDLRSPAGSIAMALRMVLSGRGGPLTDRQRELLELADRAVSKLLGLVSDYLDFAKLDAGYFRPERRAADLAEIARASGREAEAQAGAKRQTLRLRLPDGPVPAHVDPSRLEHLLDNLLSNAIKYTPEGGRIELALEAAGGAARYRVRDTGQGISPAELPALFTKYHRVPGEATRGIAGVGLGLLIVKEIVEAHGGTVRAASTGVPGEGTTFLVELPLGDDGDR